MRSLTNITRALLVVAVVLLLWGFLAPALTVRRLLIFHETMSILSGIIKLLEVREYMLFLIVGSFTLLFPTLKIGLLTYLAVYPSRATRHTGLLNWLSRLNKFSMLDVFVIALLIVIAKLDPLVKIEAHAGVVLFAASVMLVQFVTILQLRIGQIQITVDRR